MGAGWELGGEDLSFFHGSPGQCGPNVGFIPTGRRRSKAGAFFHMQGSLASGWGRHLLKVQVNGWVFGQWLPGYSWTTVGIWAHVFSGSRACFLPKSPLFPPTLCKDEILS